MVAIALQSAQREVGSIPASTWKAECSEHTIFVNRQRLHVADKFTSLGKQFALMMKIFLVKSMQR